MHTKIKTRFTKYLCFNQNNSIIEIENKLSHQLFRVYNYRNKKKYFCTYNTPPKGIGISIKIFVFIFLCPVNKITGEN